MYKINISMIWEQGLCKDKNLAYISEYYSSKQKNYSYSCT